MAGLIVSTWCWGDKYPQHYIDRLRAGVSRHLKQPHRFEVYRPGACDLNLTQIPGCYARLRMFSPAWQKANGINEGDRLVCIDLDTVITGPLDPLFDREEPYVIMSGGNSSNPCPFGGALQMIRAGAHPEVWSDFSLEKAAKVPFHEFHDDQGWIHHMLPGAATWKCGPDTGVYVFQKTVWPKGENLPKGARLVTFNGHRDPSKFMHVPWIKENWA